mmetsp:Transcript_17198/g.39630  ORF Transcript_17198/g.39630 Transcript_17198/m.39630 type:complete len:242 (+) Transcript_17198:208-933(+)
MRAISWAARTQRASRVRMITKPRTRNRPPYSCIGRSNEAARPFWCLDDEEETISTGDAVAAMEEPDNESGIDDSQNEAGAESADEVQVGASVDHAIEEGCDGGILVLHVVTRRNLVLVRLETPPHVLGRTLVRRRKLRGELVRNLKIFTFALVGRRILRLGNWIITHGQRNVIMLTESPELRSTNPVRPPQGLGLRGTAPRTMPKMRCPRLRSTKPRFPNPLQVLESRSLVYTSCSASRSL